MRASLPFPVATRRTLVAVLLAALVSAPEATPASARRVGPSAATGLAAPTLSCDSPQAGVLERAADLMANRYTLGTHPSVELAATLTWAEDPFGDRNWRFLFHGLDWLLTLLDAADLTGEAAYRERALDQARSWLELNPRAAPPSDFSWNDHSTAVRAQILVCLDKAAPGLEWLREGLRLHGRVLADPDFYVKRGNHALNQDIGLLEIACRLGRDGWADLAAGRIETLLRRSVDRQGVVNEQAVGYQLYNYHRYTVARDALLACGRPQPRRFARVRRIPRFLGHATQPDGRYPLIGDTLDVQASIIPGTIAAFAASLGAQGPRPGDEVFVFDRGYIFGRTGWGETRPFGDEAYFTLRFGDGKESHGHDDQGSLTLFGYGSRLLLDPGFFAYEADRWRRYFQSRAAHNAVVAQGVRSRWRRPTRLLRTRLDRRTFEALLDVEAHVPFEHRRRVVFSRRLGYLVVEDRLRSTAGRKERFSQLWHLRESSRPVVGGSTVRTRRDRGNVVIRQLLPVRSTRLVSGRDDPIQGWLSYRYRQRRAAPVVEARLTGRRARYLTLIVPVARAGTRVRVTDLRVTGDGLRAVVTVGRKRERIVLTGDGAHITWAR